MRRFLHNNGLSVTLFGCFLAFQIGLSIVGQRQYNQELITHHLPTVTYGKYLGSDAFVEATMENWESEFLQIFAYVVLTAFLYQRGSAESKDPSGGEAVDREPRQAKKILRGRFAKAGLALVLYSHSLSLSLFLLFGISFWLHAFSGAKAHSLFEVAHGNEAVA